MVISSCTTHQCGKTLKCDNAFISSSWMDSFTAVTTDPVDPLHHRMSKLEILRGAISKHSHARIHPRRWSESHPSARMTINCSVVFYFEAIRSRRGTWDLPARELLVCTRRSALLHLKPGQSRSPCNKMFNENTWTYSFSEPRRAGVLGRSDILVRSRRPNECSEENTHSLDCFKSRAHTTLQHFSCPLTTTHV